MSDLIKFSHRAINSGSSSGVSSTCNSTEISLPFSQRHTQSCHVSSTIVTVFSAQFVVSFSTAWRC